MKCISVAVFGAYVTKKLIMLLDWLAAARDTLARHAGCVAAGHVADCGLATAIGIVGTCDQIR